MEYNKYSTFIKFTLKLFVLIIIVILLDGIIGKTLNYFYFKQTSGDYYRATYAIEQATPDLLIFGSSRANHHYVPEVFEDSLNLSYLNVGRDGNFLLYHKALLTCILKRYTPKMIILDFNPGEMITKSDTYERLNTLLPYYSKYPEIDETIKLRGRFEGIKLWSKIYPYNSFLLNIISGNLNLQKKSRLDNKGYIPLSKTWNEPLKEIKRQIGDIDTNILNAYKSFIKNCKEKKVKLFIVVSPVFYSYGADSSIALAAKIANESNIPFIDYSKNDLFLNNKEYFQDVFHLNNEGAIMFSNLLVDSLNNMKS